MDLNKLLSFILRGGVLASVAFSLIGLGAWAINNYAVISAASGQSVWAQVASSLQGNASGLIYVAVAVLIATPVVRVAFSTLYFARDGDRKYVLITLAVLAMLIFALVTGSSA